MCAFRGDSSAAALQTNRAWLEQKFAGREGHLRWISSMWVTSSETTESSHGCELRADSLEELRGLCDEILREGQMRVLRWDRSDESAALTFMRRNDLMPFSWWDVLATASPSVAEEGEDAVYALRPDERGRFFVAADLCLPRELSALLRVFVMRVRCFDASAEIAGISVVAVGDDADGVGVHRWIDDPDDEADLLREALGALRSARIDVLTGPDPDGDLRRIRARARWRGVPEHERELPASLRPSLGKMAQSDVRIYAERMKVFRRCPDDALPAEDRFRTETNLLLRVLRERRVVSLELFVHAITRRYPFERCGLTIGEHDMEGAMRYVRHAYHERAETMSPPRFVLSSPTNHREDRLPGGYNLPPQVGAHRRGVTAFDFRSFYPTCIRSYNLDTGLVSGSDRSVQTWVPLVPLHIGDVSGTHACDCCRRDTFRPDVSRVLGEVRLGDRRMRIWRNEEGDDDVCYVCPSTTTASVASELLEGFVNCRARMRSAEDPQGEMACKILANSVFGVFGFFGSPGRRNELYDAACYRAVVQAGRNHLLRAVLELQGQGHRVLYGDTDSLFVDDSSLAEVGADAIGRRVTDALSKTEGRPCLMRADGEARHLVELRASERFRGAVILAKKRYVAIPSGTDDLKFCGFSREPKFDERCDRAFVEFCVRDALARRTDCGKDETAVARLVLRFLSWFNRCEDVRRFWFLVDGESTDDGQASCASRTIRPASTIWRVLDRRMKDRNFRAAIFSDDVAWQDHRWIAERMVHNRFHRSYPETDSASRSVMLARDDGGAHPTCDACKREEVVDPSGRTTVDAGRIVERVRACGRKTCEMWHAGSSDW